MRASSTHNVQQGKLFTGISFLSVTAGALALFLFAILFGAVNQDEGWYLYAARSVTEGLFPYRDFFFTQGPIHPLFYGAFANVWSPSGLLGGRIFTAGLGLASALFAALLARRAVPAARGATAALIAFSLTACNLYHVYFTTLPKTYALSALFVNAGFWLLTYTIPRGTKRNAATALWALPAGFLLALAAGTRLSLGLLLPITALALLVWHQKNGFLSFFWFCTGGVIGLILTFLPPLLHAKEAFLFSQLFHTSRGGRDLFLMAGSLSRLVRFYLPLTLLASWLILQRQTEEDTLDKSTPYVGSHWPLLWIAGAFSVFLLQLTTPHPYDDYQVPLMGLFAAAVAGLFVQRIRRPDRLPFYGFFWILATLLCSFGSPLAQEWFVQKIDRFWVVKKSQSDLQQMRQTAREIQKNAQDGMLLTQDLYLAVEAGLHVPKGLEMGPFSYFPHLTDQDAEKFHVLNENRLRALLASAPCRTAAYSGYGWAIQSPAMDHVPEETYQEFLAILHSKYRIMKEIPDFGQNKTKLTLLNRQSPLSTR